MTPSPVMQPQCGRRSISDFPTLQTAETKITSASCPTVADYNDVKFPSQSSMSQHMEVSQSHSTYISVVSGITSMLKVPHYV